MLEESLLKTNFIGRDGFRWWIGQICSAAEQAQPVKWWWMGLEIQSTYHGLSPI